MLYTAALRFAAETMKSMCRRQVESKLRGFGHRLGPDQNGCPEDVV